MSLKYCNPVIPGFYPDPSICRVGEDYYLVNSSFEFFPGVPLYHSRDLISWEQIGHVLTRKSQLSLEGCPTSGGIFAPTIRYHEGRFYMVTTNVTGGGHFFVWTDDIHGEWSDPIWVKQMGIDPSLFWDDDGRVYFHSTFFDPETHRQCIGQSEIDLKTGQLLTETRPIWFGTGGKCPEGPHLYKIRGMYYLMIAEGGTEYGHMETVARSHSPWGPFESCPHNPILTQRDYMPKVIDYSKPVDAIQGVGHADLVDDPEGNWWLVFHGFRPSQSMLHHIGRETMVAPVVWDEEDWPVVNSGNPITPEMELPSAEQGRISQNSFGFSEDFTQEERLPVRWAHLRNPVEESYMLSSDGLELTAGENTLEGSGSPTFLGVRQRQFRCEVKAVMDFSPASNMQEAGITVFHTAEHHYDLVVTCRNGKRAALLRRRVCDLLVESEAVELPESGRLALQIQSDRLHYTFFAGPEGDELLYIGEGRTQPLSTELTAGTFTGCFLGMFAQGKDANAKFLRFHCAYEG